MPPMPINPMQSTTHNEPTPRQEARVPAGTSIAARHLDSSAARHAAQPTTHAHDMKSMPKGHPRGRVYALKDGSGFVVQGTDGNYYRLDTSGGHGLISSPAVGYVEATLVNVSGGPVSFLGGAQPDLPGGTLESEPPPLPLIKDTGDARNAVDATHAMIRQSPATALRSQANLDPMNVLLLLR